MNRRGKRLTIGVMAGGLVVVLVLAIAHWSTVRDHVEAWWFQLTRETETIPPNLASQGLDASTRVTAASTRVTRAKLHTWLQALSNHSGFPTIVEPRFLDMRLTFTDRRNVGLTSSTVLVQALERTGCRILEQRFPA